MVVFKLIQPSPEGEVAEVSCLLFCFILLLVCIVELCRRQFQPPQYTNQY
jgi:hypothetical protein